MTDQNREKVIKGLKQFIADFKPFCGNKSDWQRVDDALVLLKSSFTPKEVYDTVIEHGQHDKRFKLGGTIDYTFTEAVDILNNELMCKAGDM